MSLAFAPRLAALQPSLIRRVFDAAPVGALNMGLGMPDLAAPAIALEAAAAALATGRAPYTPNAGAPALRQAVARLYQSRAAAGRAAPAWASAEGVVITAGVQEGLFVALTALCSPGQALLVPAPGFPAYAMIAQVLGLRVRSYDSGPAAGFVPTASAIEAALAPDVAAVILNSPGNPLGSVASAAQLQEIAALLEAHQVPYVSDEIYEDYCWEGQPASVAAFSQRGVVVGGLSKSANLMGWRLGWLLAPPQSAQPLIATHQVVCTCASSLSQAAALPVVEALAGGPGAEQLQRNLEVFAQRRQRAVEALARYGLRHAPAQGAFYLWVDVSPHLAQGEDDIDLCMRLLREQALIAIPGQGFGGEVGRGFVRLAYTCHEVEEGIARLARGLGLS